MNREGGKGRETDDVGRDQATDMHSATGLRQIEGKKDLDTR